jgi:hypothetical protein
MDFRGGVMVVNVPALVAGKWIEDGPATERVG